METLRESHSFKKRDEDHLNEEHSPFWAIEKGAVLQEARCFNDTQLSSRKCQQVITKLLYLYNQGQLFTKTEATEVFFSVTKLFHATDGNLRRLLYLIIKEISPSSDEVIIVTSSLMKDMNSKVDLYRASSIRVLCSITDSSLLGQIERFLKQAVVDKSAIVSSAALVSGLKLMQVNPDIVRRWSGEVQEAASSENALVQFHAIALLQQIKQNDRLAVNKLIAQCVRSNIRSPLATCLVIRYVSECGSEVDMDIYLGFLEGCLRNKSEMVVFEAAKNIAQLPDVDSGLLQSAMVVLQLLLTSPKTILRFGAVRTLDSIANKDPAIVSVCNAELESLASDSNQAISTSAITTLLRTGSETSIDKLMRRITSLFTGLQDEYKLVVINTIQTLCSKYPRKHRSFVSFLSSSLREEGGLEYKQAIVNCMLHIVHTSDDVKELGLIHLSEFIEDCEYTQLSIHILHVLGEDGPFTDDPSKFIRYIYNRLFLENAAIRAAAVSALTSFGLKCPALRDQLSVLLTRCVHDIDDEVRDRATLFGSWLQLNAHRHVPNLDAVSDVENALETYLQSSMNAAFCIADVKHRVGLAQSDTDVRTTEKTTVKQEHVYVHALKASPQLSTLGNYFTSSSAIPLTESETEYKVTCVKYIFPEHLVFQFICVNTIEEQVLDNVSVQMENIVNPTDLLRHENLIVLPRLTSSMPGYTYVVFERSQSIPFCARFTCSLRFTAKEIDPISGEPEEIGYEDDYLLEDISVNFPDFVSTLELEDMTKAWENFPDYNELSSNYELEGHTSLDVALNQIISMTRLTLWHSAESQQNGNRQLKCVLGGIVDWDTRILVHLELSTDDLHNIHAHAKVRATTSEASRMLLDFLID